MTLLGGRVTQPNRLPDGGRVDRARPVTFRFNGAEFQGYAGDTLAVGGI